MTHASKAGVDPRRARLAARAALLAEHYVAEQFGGTWVNLHGEQRMSYDVVMRSGDLVDVKSIPAGGTVVNAGRSRPSHVVVVVESAYPLAGLAYPEWVESAHPHIVGVIPRDREWWQHGRPAIFPNAVECWYSDDRDSWPPLTVGLATRWQTDPVLELTRSAGDDEQDGASPPKSKPIFGALAPASDAVEAIRADWRRRKDRQRQRDANAPAPLWGPGSETPLIGRLRSGLARYYVPGRGSKRRKEDE